MAIVKVAKGGRSLKQALDYINKDKDFIGKDLSDNKDNALLEMQTTKKVYSKEDGRQYKHYIISFKPNEADKELAKKIALEFSEKNFKGFEVGIGTHTDTNHIHCHLIVNSVSFETGKKFNEPKSFLQELKNSNDEICKSHGLEIVQKKPQQELTGQVRSYSMEKYQVLKKAFEENKKSYVLDTAMAVKKAMKVSTNKNEFIKNMETLGYKTNWIETQKNVTFKNLENKKVRLSNLEKTFSDNYFSKESLQNEFERKNIGTRKDERGDDFKQQGAIERDKRAEQDFKSVHDRYNGQRDGSEYDNDQRTQEDRGDEFKDTKGHDVDLERVTYLLKQLQQHNAEELAESRERNKQQQQDNNKRANESKERNENRNIKRDEQNKSRDKGYER